MPDSDSSSMPRARRGPLTAVLDLFSSVWFGVILLAVLFVYMTIGSAGVIYPVHPNILHKDAWVHAQMRQWRPFEMTEFEWFHWWPFDLLIGLIAVNMIVTTLRRIPFKVVNYGVWMIHGGIIMMIVGCVIYFGTKVEGDALVQRRMVFAEFLEKQPDGTMKVTDRVAFAASPGARAVVGSNATRYDLEIASIDPNWEMRSEEAKGETAYSVNVEVRRSGSDASSNTSFMRQLLAGHPEHTEDVIRSNDPQQPMQRAKKALGTPLVDESIRMSLDYAPQPWFYLRPELEKCWALYVRKPGEATWTERPIEGLPLYNDYVGSRDQVFTATGRELAPSPLDIAIPPAEGDPFPDLTFRASGFLRYAVDRAQYRAGAPTGPLNPVVQLALAGGPDAQPVSMQLEALDPRANKGQGDLIGFYYVDSEAAFAKRAAAPSIRVRVPALGVDVREELANLPLGDPNAPFVAVQKLAADGTATGDQTGYAYRLVAVQDDILLSTGTASVAIIEVKTPQGTFRRWVFDDPRLTRDATDELMKDPHAAQSVADPSIEIEYQPGLGSTPIAVVAGPDPQRLRLVTMMGKGQPTVRDLSIGEAVTFPAGFTIGVTNYLPRAVRDVRPFVVPVEQRDRDAGVQLAQMRLDVPGIDPVWLPFHQYVFDSPLEVPRRHTFRPTALTLADGRQVEVIFGRQRLRLPSDIALEEFVLDAHVGGFTGEQSTIRDYTSLVRFRDASANTWSEPVRVSVNKPVEHGGLSYFQSQWDPPDQPRSDTDRGSLGLNYTVLGVGNRHGVWTMLVGTCIACIGMGYAFYVKPLIKRRRRDEVMASLAGAAKEGA
jgi:hypothetical protein